MAGWLLGLPPPEPSKNLIYLEFYEETMIPAAIAASLIFLNSPRA